MSAGNGITRGRYRFAGWTLTTMPYRHSDCAPKETAQ